MFAGLLFLSSHASAQDTQEDVALHMMACEGIQTNQLAALLQLELGHPVGLELRHQNTILIQLLCRPDRTIRITLTQASRQAFSRDFIGPSKQRGNARFLALAAAEAFHDWQLLRKLQDDPTLPPPLPTAQASTPLQPPPPAPDPSLVSMEVYALGSLSRLPGLPWGGGARWRHHLGPQGGYTLGVQASQTNGSAELGEFQISQYSMEAGYGYMHHIGMWLLSGRLSLRPGLVSYQGSTDRQDVRVSDVTFFTASANLGLEASLVWSGGMHMGIGGEVGANMISASAKLNDTERLDGQGFRGQMSAHLGWLW